MALTLLGAPPVAIESNWVSFDPIELRSGRAYLVEALISSNNPQFIYSRFVFRYQYPTESTADAVSANIAEIFYSEESQFFELRINGNLIPRSDTILQVKRIPIFSDLSLLADTDVAISIDPDINYRY